jgi:hypothetical protein
MDDQSFDPMVNAEVILPHKEGDMLATVKCHKRDGNGNFVGRKHKNPVLDSTFYEIEFLDGERQEISFNILAEHLLSQVDEEGKQYQIFRDIIDHRRHPKKAVKKADQYFTRNGLRRRQQRGGTSIPPWWSALQADPKK